MPEKMGKYHVLERIGRGGMGMILKGHDPVLDRPVALKVISNDIEVTDELRARFYREAQACARLSHPNIVTVHDMGEDDGRLYIVMELLEGDELRRLFAPHRTLPLEDKLAIMSQVCDGPHYAHQKGVVHRDIKPSNIFVLRNGQVKIVDFGIAQIATEGGMTRTGLIMGTLRYISPEQVRGRADHRSDIFSAGTVFYELLGSRPAFPGDDPLQLLEQLRSDDPPALDLIDPTIPPELAGILVRAMRKDPAERFENFELMRNAIEQVRRGMEEEAQGLRARVRAQREQVLALRAALVERIGPLEADETAMAVAPDRARLAALQAAERELGVRIETMQARLARAEAVAPAVQRGVALLEAGRFGDAVVELEAALAEVPEHWHAREALEQARTGAEAEQRARRAETLVREARGALERGDVAGCLGLLDEADVIPPPAEVVPSITALRQQASLAAQAEALAAQAEARAAQEAAEAARRARQHAEQSRDRMAQARGAAETETAPHVVPGLWADAEAGAARAHAAFEGEAYSEAGRAFDAAATAYRQAMEAAREARQRQAAERARDETTRARGEAAGAEHYARDLWAAAEAKAAEADAALSTHDLGGAIDAFGDALASYRRARDAADAAREDERRRAADSRQQSGRARLAAEAANASHYSADLWQRASARWTEAESAFRSQQHAEALEAFDAAATLYRQAEETAQAARRHARDEAEGRRQEMESARGAAMAADAARHASAEWQEAERSAAAGHEAFGGEAYLEGSRVYGRGVTLYQRAEEQARAVVRALELARADAEHAREASGLSRGAAATARAERYASEQWQAGESAEAQARTALDRQDHRAAHALFVEARRQYSAAVPAARAALEAETRRERAELEAETRRLDGLVDQARRLLATGEVPACIERLNDVLALRPGYEPAERLRGEAAAMLRRIEAERRAAEAAANDAQAGADAPTVRIDFEPATAPTRVTPSVRSPELPAAGDEIGEPVAPAAPPPGRPWPWRRLGAGAVALGALAAVAVVALQVRPPDRAPVAPVAPPPPPAVTPPPSRPEPPRAVQPPPGRELAEELRKRMIAARDDAAQAGAERLAQPSFGSGTEKAREAEASMGRQDMTNAQQRYNEAIAAFGQAKAEAIQAAALARKEGDVRAAASRAAEARRAAEVVDAPNLAKGVWTTAEGAQRKAEDSFKQRAFDRARSLYGDAEKSFRAAAKAASDSAAISAAERDRVAALKRGLEEAEQSRRTAVQARETAEKADAARLASRTFAAAQGKQGEGDAALNRQDSASAKLRFQEAQQAYRQAAQEAATEAARVAALQRQQADAEQARERMTAARRAAVQASAARYAPKLFATAQSKDTDASAALGRSDWSGALRLFGDARADYQAAVQEARRESEREGRQVEQTRTAMLARREEAMKAGADRLAKDAFDAAQARQGQADDLVARQNFAAALPAYQDATERYGDAGRQAKAAQAKLDERRAEPPPPPPKPVEKQEARKVEPAPAPPRPAPEDEVRSVLAGYVRGFETKDVALLQQLRPGLKPDEVRRLQESFEQSREYRVSVKVDSLDVQGDQAVVKGRRTDTVVSRAGQSFRNDSAFTYRLKRAGPRWVIDAVN